MSQLVNFIKAGTYGKVYKMSSGDVQKYFSLFDPEDEQEDNNIKIPDVVNSSSNFANIAELIFLSNVSHPGIAKIKSFTLDPSTSDCSLAMEDCGVNLYNYRRSDKTDEEIYDMIPQITCDILEVLVFLEEHGLLHGDLSGGNVVIDNDGVTRVIDWGSVIFLIDTITFVYCTSSFAAPEYHRQAPHKTSDVYSLGCLIYFLFHDSFYDKEEECDECFEDYVDDDFIELYKSMLEFSPLKRPTAKQLYDNKFFTPYKRVRVDSKVAFSMKRSEVNIPSTILYKKMRVILFDWIYDVVTQHRELRKKKKIRIFEMCTWICDTYVSKIQLKSITKSNFQLIGSACYVIATAMFGEDEFKYITHCSAGSFTYNQLQKTTCKICNVCKFKFTHENFLDHIVDPDILISKEIILNYQHLTLDQKIKKYKFLNQK